MEHFKKHKRSWIMLAIAMVAILVSSFFGSLIQSRGWSIKVSDLRDETNTGAYYDATGNEVDGVTIKGRVVSGILYMPKDASEDNKLPAIVLTHGYLNNRELQLPNAVELARRGFIVLAIDREGHGNYENENDTGALMATNGMYDSVKYLYNLPEVDKDRIGITGHSMGGYTTAMTLYNDSAEAPLLSWMSEMAAIEKQIAAINEDVANGDMSQVKADKQIAELEKSKLTMDAYLTKTRKSGTGLGIISAGLMQGWDTFIYADSSVDVGILKARDDEFFFTSTDVNGNPTICRQYLQSVDAADFVGDEAYKTTGVIDIKNGGIYVGGKLEETTQGTAVEGAFRVVYEAPEIHPLNHFSVESTGNVVDFFYNAFGTPNGHKTIKSTNQVWVLKEIMATIGWVGIIFMIFPLVNLLLTLPVFAELKKRRIETAEGTIVYEDVDPEVEKKGKNKLHGLRRHLSLWIPAVACTLFSGFSIAPIQKWAGSVIEQTPYFPQDTTGWVALWAICCGLFALVVVLLTNVVNRVIDHFVYKKEPVQSNEVLDAARIGSVGRMIKTVVLAATVVVAMYLVLFINWAIWKVDFRFWTFAMKVFDVEIMLPTILRYAGLFGIFYICNGICNATYRFENLPEWATIAINAAFNVIGIGLVFAIQYGKFCTTGVMWKPDMNLSYIVLFPIIPVLICELLFQESYTRRQEIFG